MKTRYIWLIQCNWVESTDEIYVFSSKKKALEWLEENQSYDDEYEQHTYTYPRKMVLE